MSEDEFNQLDDVPKLEYLLDTEEGLQIPTLRRKDYMWLLRNFSIRNSEHPKFEQIMGLLRKIALNKLHRR